MKSLMLALSLVVWFSAHTSWARCPPNTKCFNFSTAAGAAASREEAERLRNDISALGTEEIVRNCKPGLDTKVTEVFGEVCAPGTLAKRVCNYETNLDCTLNGKSFDMRVNGACKGGIHDCGTFSACALDSGVKVKDGGFRSANSAVPKGSNLNGGIQ